MYLDQHGILPPNPNPLFSHYERLIVKRPGFLRFRKTGLGNDSEARKYYSWVFGRAFCRWFLEKHLKYTYFTHISSIIGNSTTAAKTNLTVSRASKGDTPDYLCADTAQNACLSEAKGSQETGTFPILSKQTEWQKQFQRVAIKDPNGQQVTLKEYLCATRLVTAANSKVKPLLWVKDPDPPDGGPSSEENLALTTLAMKWHYATVFDLLGLPNVAEALRSGRPLDSSDKVDARVGELTLSDKSKSMPVVFWSGVSEPHSRRYHPNSHTYGPISSRPSFLFGMELSRARQIVRMATGDLDVADEVQPLEAPSQLPDCLSMLRAGTVIGPARFFEGIRPMYLRNQV